uniref:Translational activator of cytochrome c oxidase 1 n=2 Tax=Graphocephala atropunctata TaxID=36148 RepID=A0A1B6LI28_9HEMI
MYVREVFLVLRRYAGHSKWQNIKHTKALKDTQRSLLFVRLCQRIKVAIQENGNNTNPASNPQLSQAIENARKSDMPVSTVQSCIKSTQSNKESVQPYRYSIKGPKGSILLVTALTSSQKKTKHELQFHLKKVGGIMADQSLEGNFDKKGMIVGLPPPDVENIEETSVDHAIEAGAEEVLPPDENNKLIFFCEMGQLHKVRDNLGKLNYSIEDTKVTLIPKMRVSLSDDEMEFMSKVVARLEDHPEVVDIHDNIE